MKACGLERHPEQCGEELGQDEFTRIILVPLNDPDQLAEMIGKEDEERPGWFCERLFLDRKHEGKALVHLVYRQR